VNDTTLMLWALTNGWQATNGKLKSEPPGWYWWGHDKSGKRMGHRVLSESPLPAIDQKLRNVLVQQIPSEVKTLRHGPEPEYAKDTCGQVKK
jgi:hypothetical protein